MNVQQISHYHFAFQTVKWQSQFSVYFFQSRSAACMYVFFVHVCWLVSNSRKRNSVQRSLIYWYVYRVLVLTKNTCKKRHLTDGACVKRAAYLWAFRRRGPDHPSVAWPSWTWQSLLWRHTGQRPSASGDSCPTPSSLCSEQTCDVITNDKYLPVAKEAKNDVTLDIDRPTQNQKHFLNNVTRVACAEPWRRLPLPRLNHGAWRRPYWTIYWRKNAQLGAPAGV